MLKIRTSKGTFTVKFKPAKTPNNLTVHIFLNQDKLPIFGTTFNSNTPPDEIKAWADTQVTNYPKSINRYRHEFTTSNRRIPFFN